MSPKKAFSLIELSIVILVIGILVAGITQSSRMINAFRLTNARSLTQNSPVHSIPGILFWLETSLENSFITAQSDDGQYVTEWHDINQQTITKFNFTRVSSNDSIVFKGDAINNIPSLYFKGISTTGAHLETSAISLPSNNNFTLFLVFKSEDANSSTSRIAFYYGNTAANGFGYLKGAAVNPGERMVLFGGSAYNRTSNSDSTTNPEIISLTYKGTTSALYVNGSSRTLYDVGSMKTPSSTYFPSIGAAYDNNEPWQGYISEVILFDHALKNSERQDIEKYLGKKYSINVS